ncbi:maleylpyruvate isomerase family mycothiol-dependent enzyme [Mycolicibacterium stellerae]|uniref:maleylpyruvate isomerase family mycothiol-dependent enzyme n=1 Tax=Mycolicibacterium stellerae TaxID=2358193 RepID=UPI000F0B7605|nr:maleylpyruvate isomerase family mycothiol-dependent enzyme [Mycolicibacterium stellerae]
MSVRDVMRESDERFRGVACGFSADDWSSPSLCERWTNHQVLAHLVVGISAPLHSVGGAVLRHRGTFDDANAEMATALAAARPPAELLDDFERLSREPRGIGRYFPPRLLLGDHVTHELDMLFALDVEPQIPSEVLVAVLNTQVAVPNPFVPAFGNARGLRLRATDTAWRHGERGPVVDGRAAELVSVLGNRRKVLPRLGGDGVAVLEARLSLPTRTGG